MLFLPPVVSVRPQEFIKFTLALRIFRGIGYFGKLFSYTYTYTSFYELEMYLEKIPRYTLIYVVESISGPSVVFLSFLSLKFLLSAGRMRFFKKCPKNVKMDHGSTSGPMMLRTLTYALTRYWLLIGTICGHLCCCALCWNRYFIVLSAQFCTFKPTSKVGTRFVNTTALLKQLDSFCCILGFGGFCRVRFWLI